MGRFCVSFEGFGRPYGSVELSESGKIQLIEWTSDDICFSL